MRTAIGMVELNSIAKGIETCDYMVKAAQVELIRSSTVCPGKYLILIAGDTGDVRASMKEGEKRGGECVVDTLLLPNVHPQLIPAISMATPTPALGAVGVLEFYSVASAITAAGGGRGRGARSGGRRLPGRPAPGGHHRHPAARQAGVRLPAVSSTVCLLRGRRPRVKRKEILKEEHT